MKNINVTKSYLPPLNEYVSYIKEIWHDVQLTNQGPLLKRFESNTKQYLRVKNFHFVNNGTTALQLALNALGICEGEIITTPFSFVATTSAILWERCKPVFVDIEPETYCIDTRKIEAAITHKTKAILAVHVFGFPCAVEEIDAIAKKHRIKVIYDGAHAFGVQYKGRSLLDYGDISICSFHATKLIHSVEGGGIIAKEDKVSEKLELIKRYGFNGDNHYMLGINAKASEFHAAMGLCTLNHIDEIINKRRKITETYDRLLDDHYKKCTVRTGVVYNYNYYPVLFDSESKLLAKMEELKKIGIIPMRYFYPSLNTLPYIKNAQKCPVSEDIATRILCLPLYPDLAEKTVAKICGILNK